jgi:hypothetical protein
MFTDLFHLNTLRRCWSESKSFRWLLSLALIYLAGRVAVQSLVLAQVWAAGPVASETTLISNDLQIYLAAANRLANRQDLYLQEALDKIAVFQYAPAYALFFTLFLPVPFGLLALGHTLLNMAAYGLLYLWWGRLFRRLGLDQADKMLALTTPLWIIFAAFWGDLAYLNIYVLTTLICTWLIEAVLEERLGWSLLWLSLLLQAKPYLAFPLALPLLLGRPRFFLKLLGLALLGYGALTGLTIVLMGPAYGWQQHLAYLRFLAEMAQNFPWRGPDSGFLGYNHSILQISFYLLGVTPAALRLAGLLKILLLLPLALIILRRIISPAHPKAVESRLQPVPPPKGSTPVPAHPKALESRLQPVAPPKGSTPVPAHPKALESRLQPVPAYLSLDLAFALYAAAMIWLDIVWEMTLGIVIFAYLLATLERRAARFWAWAVFLPYALLDLWQVLSFAALGPAIFASGLYIWTDPSIYLPMVMLVIVTFYALLVGRLWAAPAQTPVLSRSEVVLS